MAPGFTCTAQPQTVYNCSLANCYICATSTTCANCLLGYFMDSNSQCQPNTCTVPFCNTCQGSECVACQQDLVLSGGACLARSYGCNISNCVFCRQPNQCQECSQGYFVNYRNGYICTPINVADL